MDLDVVVAQYRAALAMLRSAVAACPEKLWDRDRDCNRFWAIAYHALFHAHLYASPSEEAFEPWNVRVHGHPGFGRSPLGRGVTSSSQDTYSQADILAYCDHVDALVPTLVRSAHLGDSSGFHGLPFSRGEAHLYNIRHIQHHAGQLIERLRQETNGGIDWVASVRKSANQGPGRLSGSSGGHEPAKGAWNVPGRFAVVSDIHGNWRALDAVLLDLERREITEVVNLGDCLYGPFDPRCVADALMELDWPTVSGNEDQALVNVVSEPTASRVARFTAGQLGPEHIAWLGKLPLRLDILGSTAFHARPDGLVAYLLTWVRDDGDVRPATAPEIARRLETSDGLSARILCGHDHLARILTLPDGRVLVNPGSVGCPAFRHDDPLDHVVENGSPHARYAIVEDRAEGTAVELVAVSYDWDNAAAEATRNGFPDWGQWLATGRVR